MYVNCLIPENFYFCGVCPRTSFPSCTRFRARRLQVPPGFSSTILSHRMQFAPTHARRPHRLTHRAPLVLWLAVLFLLMVGCGKSGDSPSASASRPPAQVGVVTVTQGDVALISELPGRLEASRVAQVRARAAEFCKNGFSAKAVMSWSAKSCLRLTLLLTLRP